MDPILTTNQLQKQYQMGEVLVHALRGVNFKVEQGEFVAIMGPSGSGKSTLLHLLGGLDNPTGGDISLSGQEMAHLSDDEITLLRRRKVGFIFQFFNLLPTLTAAENIFLPLMLDGQRITDHQERIHALLHLVGLEERKDHKPNQLSGGQQQRVAIARAFATEPSIVLADEPTGNLDSNSGTVVLEMLQRVCKELNTTVVMVTHDPRAASYADRVVFLKDGQITRELPKQLDGHSIQSIMDVMSILEL